MQRFATHSERILTASSARGHHDLLSTVFELLFLVVFDHLAGRSRRGAGDRHADAAIQ
jgi:hypothetical protein